MLSVCMALHLNYKQAAIWSCGVLLWPFWTSSFFCNYVILACFFPINIFSNISRYTTAITKTLQHCVKCKQRNCVYDKVVNFTQPFSLSTMPLSDPIMMTSPVTKQSVYLWSVPQRCFLSSSQTSPSFVALILPWRNGFFYVLCNVGTRLSSIMYIFSKNLI